MSIRTIIEINHDQLLASGKTIEELIKELAGTFVTATLNKMGPFSFGPGVNVIAQRHHSEDASLHIGNRVSINLP